MKVIMNHGFVNQGLDFPGAFFICPEQIIPWMEDQGFSILDLVGCEGITAGHEDQVNLLKDKDWEFWVDLNYLLGRNPALHGAADHLRHTGRKQKS